MGEYLRPLYIAMHEKHASYRNSPEKIPDLNTEFRHAVDILAWVRKLSPDPSLELQTAALLHDSERWTNTAASSGFQGDRQSPEYLLHKKEHGKRSAASADIILEHTDIQPESRERVRFLITHHDDTGEEIARFHDPELELLAAADSFSFFTSIAPTMLAREGEARLTKKIIFMVNKMPPILREILRDQSFDNPTIDAIKSSVLELYV